jgi:hypothetical protein
MNISVIGLWRDAEKYISSSLSNMDRLTHDCKTDKFSFYFYENDSKDNTKNILSEWVSDNNGQLMSETLNFPKYGSVPNIERLILLSIYRNKLLSLIRKVNTEYTLMIDTDITFNTDDFLLLLESIKNIPDAVMVVSNTRQKEIQDLMFNKTTDSFYDVFALRDKYFNHGLYFTDCPLVLQEDRDLWIENKPVRINCGFGGFALIKTDVLKKCIWSTSGHSEHINFCIDVGRYGNIYVVPSSKPYANIDMSGISIERCNDITKQQIQIMTNINKIYNMSNNI